MSEDSDGDVIEVTGSLRGNSSSSRDNTDASSIGSFMTRDSSRASSRPLVTMMSRSPSVHPVPGFRTVVQATQYASSLRAMVRRGRDDAAIAAAPVPPPAPTTVAPPTAAPAPSVATVAATGHRGRNRNWCFTMFIDEGTTKPFKRADGQDNIAYISFQVEVCASTGRRHYQGYVELHQQQSLSFVRALWPRAGQTTNNAHWEPRRGTQAEAIKYTSKPETAEEGTYEEIGEKRGPDAVGVMQQFIAAVQAKEVGTYRDLCVRYPTIAIQYQRSASEFITTVNPPTCAHELRQVRVILLWGDAGCGKTYRAFNEFAPKDEVFWFNGKWWDYYDPAKHKVAIVDEMNGSKMTIADFLRLTDDYPYIVERKGASIYLNVHTFVFTSQTHCKDWWAATTLKMIESGDVQTPQAIVRRFHKNGGFIEHMQRREPLPIPVDEWMPSDSARQRVEREMGRALHINTVRGRDEPPLHRGCPQTIEHFDQMSRALHAPEALQAVINSIDTA